MYGLYMEAEIRNTDYLITESVLVNFLLSIRNWRNGDVYLLVTPNPSYSYLEYPIEWVPLKIVPI